MLANANDVVKDHGGRPCPRAPPPRDPGVGNTRTRVEVLRDTEERRQHRGHREAGPTRATVTRHPFSADTVPSHPRLARAPPRGPYRSARFSRA